MDKKEKDIFDQIMTLPGFHYFEKEYQRHKEVLLYLFFGGLTCILSIGSYSYCDIGMGMDPLIANVISWILAVSFAYITNKIWVFCAETHGIKALLQEMVDFFAGRVFTLLVEELILYVFITHLAWNSIAVKVAAQVVVVVLNYVISKVIVFRQRS